jgi:light-regulated signal transduction histidine kinase (bacteriophytochrome)
MFMLSIEEEYKQFAYKVSHDLSAPLRQSSGFARILLDKHRDRLDEKSIYHLELVERSANHAQSMLSGLLSFSRLNTTPFTPEPLCIEDMLQRCISGFSHEIQRKNAILETAYSCTTITADRKRVSLLLDALIHNALTYCKDDTPPHIRITVDREADGYAIRVIDHGIGLDPTQWQRALEPLTSLHKSTYGQRAGMGLSLAYKITQQHHGQLSLESHSPTTVKAVIGELQ